MFQTFLLVRTWSLWTCWSWFCLLLYEFNQVKLVQHSKLSCCGSIIIRVKVKTFISAWIHGVWICMYHGVSNGLDGLSSPPWSCCLGTREEKLEIVQAPIHVLICLLPQEFFKFTWISKNYKGKGTEAGIKCEHGKREPCYIFLIDEPFCIKRRSSFPIKVVFLYPEDSHLTGVDNMFRSGEPFPDF